MRLSDFISGWPAFATNHLGGAGNCQGHDGDSQEGHAQKREDS
jgi:hypothetical protein